MRKILCALLGLILTLPVFATCPTGQIEQTYVSATGTVTQNGTPTPTNPIEPTFYQQGNMVLRKVGDIADSYDAITGKITRRVGVKVLDGTEIIDYYNAQTYPGIFNVEVQNKLHDVAGLPISSHFNKVNRTGITNIPVGSIGASVTQGNNVVWINVSNLIPNGTDGFNTWIAEQYNAGTPVIIYYPLATETTEDWNETTYCATNIKIATTAYNSARFSPVVTELNDTIAIIRSVVTNTINQTKAIADLQATKQTRPDENCPAGKKCLLVEDDAGQPHWYEIIENAYGLPSGYTGLEYIQSTGTQYIDTGVLVNTNYSVEAKMNIQNTGYAFYGDDTNYTAIKKFNLFIATTSGTSGWGDGTASSVHSGMGISANVDFVVKQDKTGIFINDVKKVNFTPSSSLVSSDYRFYLFRGNHEGYGSLGQSKIYYLKMYENDILVRNFVPAKRNSDNVLGLYDLANDVFYTNAGTGTFTAGPEI